MVNAAADTLRKAWRAGIDLGSRAGEHPRLGSIAALEEAALDALPPAMKRPADLVSAGLGRLDRVPTLFGPIEIVGITELSPVWRPLLHAIATKVNVRWIAGPRPVPPWLDGDAVDIVRTEPNAPGVSAVSAATAYHEAVEAMRWARELISSGRARPEDIAISSVVPAEYDDHFLALRGDANLELHFVHGVGVTTCREGQAGGRSRRHPVAGPVADENAAAECAAGAATRSVPGTAGGVDVDIASRCAAVVVGSVDSGRSRD